MTHFHLFYKCGIDDPIPVCCCPSSGFSCWGWTGEPGGLITSIAPPPVLSYRFDDTVEQIWTNFETQCVYSLLK